MKAFPTSKIVRQYSPRWLGRQRLDIYIYRLKVAIEYQGKQHDVPVEFFGGQEAFKKTKQRDARKARLCKENNVALIYVRKGYDIDAVIREIHENKDSRRK
ncbi:MAG: hypothetical protein ACE5FF_15650 [Saprospiraceae bacterium]